MNTLSCNGTSARSFRGLTKLSDPDQFRAVFAFCTLFRRGCLSCVDQSWHSVAPPKMPQSKGECVQHLSSFPLSVLTGHNAATARWKDIPDKGPSKQNKLNDEEERKKDRQKRKRKNKCLRLQAEKKKIRSWAVIITQFAVRLSQEPESL